MKLKILPVEYKDKNVFVFDIEFMSGDADGYETVSIKITDKEQALAFAIALSKLTRYYTRKDDVKADAKLDAKYPVLQQVMGDIPGKQNDLWPIDRTCEDYMAAYESHKIYWYDELGGKHPVKLTK